jgi:hypothetical protein
MYVGTLEVTAEQIIATSDDCIAAEPPRKQGISASVLAFPAHFRDNQHGSLHSRVNSVCKAKSPPSFCSETTQQLLRKTLSYLSKFASRRRKKAQQDQNDQHGTFMQDVHM